MPRNLSPLKFLRYERDGRLSMSADGNSPRKLADVLATGRLAALGREAERRRTTTERVRAQLPPDEAAHLVSASTEGDALVLVMDSAVWAARVRYRAAELGAARLKVRVLPLAKGT